jgi:RND family efflux transporter MFP subunit
MAASAGQCLIEPGQRVELRSPVSALVSIVHVERGSVVRKGQLLVTLDSSVETAALEAARFRAAMQGTLRLAEARVQNAREKLKRRSELAEQSFVSVQDRDDAAAEVRAAEAELLQAKDSLQLAQLEARQLSATVGRFLIHSPIDGVVTERLLSPGELARAGDAGDPILKLAQTHPLRVEAVLPVADYGKIKLGRVLAVRPEAPFTETYSATVKVVDRVIDSASGTFRVRLELPNALGKIPAGVRCTLGLG